MATAKAERLAVRIRGLDDEHLGAALLLALKGHQAAARALVEGKPAACGQALVMDCREGARAWLAGQAHHPAYDDLPGWATCAPPQRRAHSRQASS